MPNWLLIYYLTFGMSFNQISCGILSLGAKGSLVIINFFIREF